MPFPLAHPAAVMPLRRLCPRWFNLPALVIGSLVPDLGYAFPNCNMAALTHRSLPGVFIFDLPVALFLWGVFLAARRPAIRLLPGRYQQALLPLCHPPAKFPVLVVVSLLIGVGTHLLLDGMAHWDGWIVQRFPCFYRSVGWSGYRLRLYDVMYYAITLIGTTWLALVYFSWLGTDARRRGWRDRMARWVCAVVAGVGTVILASLSRAQEGWNLVPAALVAIALLLSFLLITARLVQAKSKVKEGSSMPR